MANLYSGTHKFSGYKTLAELTELTFEADKTYTIQIIPFYPFFYVREGSMGDGFICEKTTPFDWEYDGINPLYIRYDYGDSVYINVAVKNASTSG